jgi:hypothetical protein
MTISINSGVKAKHKTTSSCPTTTHSARHTRKTSRVHSVDKAKTGWMGAALLRGRGGIALPQSKDGIESPSGDFPLSNE